MIGANCPRLTLQRQPVTAAKLTRSGESHSFALARTAGFIMISRRHASCVRASSKARRCCRGLKRRRTVRWGRRADELTVGGGEGCKAHPPPRRWSGAPIRGSAPLGNGQFRPLGPASSHAGVTSSNTLREAGKDNANCSASKPFLQLAALFKAGWSHHPVGFPISPSIQSRKARTFRHVSAASWVDQPAAVARWRGHVRRNGTAFTPSTPTGIEILDTARIAVTRDIRQKDGSKLKQKWGQKWGPLFAVRAKFGLCNVLLPRGSGEVYSTPAGAASPPRHRPLRKRPLLGEE